MSIRVGTSGFAYPHWRRIFYPEKLPSKEWLRYFASVFTTVELNNTFYRLAKAAAVERWKRDTPRRFDFVAKGSRYITHLKRLLDAEDALDHFFEPLRPLGRRLVAILWQLPPQMKVPDLGRLDAFLAQLPHRYRHIIEFRHEAWHVDAVLDCLDKHHVAVCEHDLVGKPPPRTSGGFRYLRFHGATGKYNGRYGARRLASVSRDLHAWETRGGDAFVYFNNDLSGHAILDALTLQQQLEKLRGSGPSAKRKTTAA